MVEVIGEYKQYKKLFPHEYEAIYEFYNGGNREPLVKLLTEENTIPLSHGIKEFIADVIMGKAKSHRSNTSKRDNTLYNEVSELLNSDNHLHLRSNSKTAGAAAIVASRHNGLSEEVVLEAYRKVNNIIKAEINNY